ncbi:MAG: SemiSWEET transporter [Chitinispirillales bacterium]|jgi:MtN3 and saliva related transmembrane protein|nr:SemiSWEET transporter [Chitinispirillales bacterium]
MNDNALLELVGSIAGILTTVSLLPQVIKTYRSKSAKDLSLGMFLLFTLGVLMWLVYGIGIQKTPIIAANGVTLVLAGMLLAAKFRFRG